MKHKAYSYPSPLYLLIRAEHCCRAHSCVFHGSVVIERVRSQMPQHQRGLSGPKHTNKQPMRRFAMVLGRSIGGTSWENFVSHQRCSAATSARCGLVVSRGQHRQVLTCNERFSGSIERPRKCCGRRQVDMRSTDRLSSARSWLDGCRRASTPALGSAFNSSTELV